MPIEQQESVQVADIMHLPENGRTMCLGRTRSGKSTLMDKLMILYLANYPRARILIVDSKPRYKAQWTTSGLSAMRQYRGWSRGQFLAGSYRIDRELPVASELRRIWEFGGRIAIAQTRPGHLADLVWLQEVARTFYQIGSDRYPRLVVVDEIADFFEVKRVAGIFHQIARSGGEMNVALLAGSQRPAYIPKVVLTECDRMYLFHLDNIDDMKTVWGMGIPRKVQPPEQDHSFFYWNKFQRWRPPSGQYYKLEL